MWYGLRSIAAERSAHVKRQRRRVIGRSRAHLHVIGRRHAHAHGALHLRLHQHHPTQLQWLPPQRVPLRLMHPHLDPLQSVVQRVQVEVQVLLQMSVSDKVWER